MNTDCLPMRNSDLRAREAARQEKPAHRAGFTLIEMLVVVIIISILAGMVLGLFKIAGVWAAKSQTNERLGKVRAAIEEFYAEYGKYPPVDAKFYGGDLEFRYEYPFTNGMSSTCLETYFGGTEANKPWDRGKVFTFGLISFLVTRYAGHAQGVDVMLPNNYSALLAMDQWGAWNRDRHTDQRRDVNAIRRWTPYLDGVLSSHPQPRSTGLNIVGNDDTCGYTNIYLTVRDGWGNELHYESQPPHQSYRLWSDGPSANTTADDISTGPGH